MGFLKSPKIPNPPAPQIAAVSAAPVEPPAPIEPPPTPPPPQSPTPMQARAPGQASRGMGSYKSLIGGAGGAAGLSRKAKTTKPSLIGGA